MLSNRTVPALRVAALATTTWAVWAVVLRPDWTAALLLLSPIALAPLTLRLAGPSAPGGDGALVDRLATWAPWVAAPAAASFAVDPGPVAAALTTPWLLTTVVVAALGIGRLGRRSPGSARVALLVSAASLTLGMVLAIVWAWSVRFGWDLIGIEVMARTHGSLNALGFGVLALIGLHLLDAPWPGPDPRTLFRWGRPTNDDPRPQAGRR